MRFSKGAIRLLLNYSWPGNVRELENTVERAAILGETDVLHSHDLPDKLRTPSTASVASIESSGMTLEELEREHIKRILEKVDGDKARAAQALGIHLSTLYRKVQRYRLDGPPNGTGTEAAGRPA
jgi:DNA-binding NtrC family response regulator